MTVAEWIGSPQKFLGFVIMTDAFFPSLRALAELGVADQIDDEPVPVRALAQVCGADERSLRRVLRFVAAEGLFRMTDDDCVEHTELSRSLRSDHRLSVKNALLLRNHVEAFTKLLEGVRTGQMPHLLRFGKGYWENLSEDPDLVASFSATMTLTTPTKGTASTAPTRPPTAAPTRAETSASHGGRSIERPITVGWIT